MAIAQSESSDYEAADSTFAELIRLYPRFDNAYVGHTVSVELAVCRQE